MYSGPHYTSTYPPGWDQTPAYLHQWREIENNQLTLEKHRSYMRERKIDRQWVLILKRKAARKSITKAARKARRKNRDK